MARNIEIKARVADLGPVRAAALPLASGAPLRLEQTDTFFGVPRGRLKIRAFADGSGELIAYEREDTPGPKPSRYVRVSCDRPGDLAAALSAALPVRGMVRKQREVLIVGRTRVHLDTVEGLGSFVELEVVLADGDSLESGETEARKLLNALGIPGDDLVSGAYIDLLETGSAA